MDAELFQAELLPLGTRCGLINDPHQEPVAYLLKFRVNAGPARGTGEEERSGEGNDGVVERHVLLDAGSNRVADPRYVDASKLDAVLLSHGHLDHTIHLGHLIRALRRQKRTRPLPVVCQSNSWRGMRWLIRLFNWGRVPRFVRHVPVNLTMDRAYLKSHERASATDYTQVSSLPPLALGSELELHLQVAPAMHSKSSVAYRMTVVPRTGTQARCLDLVFSPDTSYASTHLVPFVRGAKYWLLDSGFWKEEIDRRYEMFQAHEKGGEVVCHSSPYYSGRLCEAAGVENYVVIHYLWSRFAETHEATAAGIRARARETFTGNVVVTFDLQPVSLELGSTAHQRSSSESPPAS